MTSLIPAPHEDDDEDVHWALSTASALWARGESSEALKWLRRAAENASDANEDDRALELFKAAAEVAAKVDSTRFSEKPPPPPPMPGSHIVPITPSTPAPPAARVDPEAATVGAPHAGASPSTAPDGTARSAMPPPPAARSSSGKLDSSEAKPKPPAKGSAPAVSRPPPPPKVRPSQQKRTKGAKTKISPVNEGQKPTAWAMTPPAIEVRAQPRGKPPRPAAPSAEDPTASSAEDAVAEASPPSGSEESSAESTERFEHESTVDEPRTLNVNITEAAVSAALRAAEQDEYAERATLTPDVARRGASQNLASAPAPLAASGSVPKQDGGGEFQSLDEEVTLQRDFSSMGLKFDDLEEPTSVLTGTNNSDSEAPATPRSVPPDANEVPPDANEVPPDANEVPPIADEQTTAGNQRPGNGANGDGTAEKAAGDSIAPDSMPPASHSGSGANRKATLRRASGQHRLPIVTAVRVAVLRSKTGEVTLMPEGPSGSIPVGSAHAILVPSSDADSDAINKMLAQTTSGARGSGRGGHS